jgi:hypothetical protein
LGFDFPATPTEGQVFTPPVAGAPAYIYHVPAWELVAASTSDGLLTISDGPPASPVPGQQWWESDTGLTFVWYNDGNSAQWVQTNGAGITDAPRDGKFYARKDGAWIDITSRLNP